MLTNSKLSNSKKNKILMRCNAYNGYNVFNVNNHNRNGIHMVLIELAHIVQTDLVIRSGLYNNTTSNIIIMIIVGLLNI